MYTKINLWEGLRAIDQAEHPALDDAVLLGATRLYL